MRRASYDLARLEFCYRTNRRLDGNRDGNQRERWRTLANIGGRSTTEAYTARTTANDGERRRTEKYGLENH